MLVVVRTLEVNIEEIALMMFKSLLSALFIQYYFVGMFLFLIVCVANWKLVLPGTKITRFDV